MVDPLDVELQDQDLRGEIDLVSDLMAAAAARPGPLTQAEVDAILASSGGSGGGHHPSGPEEPLPVAA